MFTRIKTKGFLKFWAAFFLMGSPHFVVAKVESSPKPTRSSSTQLIVLEHSEQTEYLRKSIQTGNWRVFGENVSAKQHCNEDTLSNPDQLEAFAVKGRGDVLVILCAGLIDGDTNSIVVFVRGKQVTSRKIKPKSSSSRISDTVLKKAVDELLSAGK